MKIYRFYHQQQLSVDINTAWEFFSRPDNLDKITPPDMDFKILSGAGESAYPGQIISYRIKPIFNFPMRWVTEITHLEPQKYFIDEQRFGPYRFWHHLHRFTPNDQGVFMEDVLHYALPLGIFGELLCKLLIHQRVKAIFDYRKKILRQKFPVNDSINGQQPIPKTYN